MPVRGQRIARLLKLIAPVENVEELRIGAQRLSKGPGESRIGRAESGGDDRWRSDTLTEQGSQVKIFGIDLVQVDGRIQAVSAIPLIIDVNQELGDLALDVDAVCENAGCFAERGAHVIDGQAVADRRADVGGRLVADRPGNPAIPLERRADSIRRDL